MRKQQCTRCKETKFIINFGRRHDNGKHSSWCKSCHKKAIKRWGLRNRNSAYTRKIDDRMYYNGNRELALVRDNYRCVQCNMSNQEHLLRWNRMITVDHINGRGDDTLSNLQTLCLLCHGHKDILRRKDFKLKEKICHY